jgi:hypothetical protein
LAVKECRDKRIVGFSNVVGLFKLSPILWNGFWRSSSEILKSKERAHEIHHAAKQGNSHGFGRVDDAGPSGRL